MKKIYSKPEIVFEDFSLSTSITAGCELETPLPSYEESCGYPRRGGGGGILFVEGTQCTTYPQDNPNDPNSSYCYHTPTDSNNLFNS